MDLIAGLKDNKYEIKHVLFLNTGEVIVYAPGYGEKEFNKEVEEKIENNETIEIDGISSKEAYKIRESFVEEEVQDDNVKKALSIVLNGKKPFSNFKRALKKWPELRQKWFDYENKRFEEKAREWLDLKDIEAELI
jgi:hypothetical protein